MKINDLHYAVDADCSCGAPLRVFMVIVGMGGQITVYFLCPLGCPPAIRYLQPSAPAQEVEA